MIAFQHADCGPFDSILGPNYHLPVGFKFAWMTAPFLPMVSQNTFSYESLHDSIVKLQAALGGNASVQIQGTLRLFTQIARPDLSDKQFPAADPFREVCHCCCKFIIFLLAPSFNS